MIQIEECEDMGCINSAANFIEAIEGAAPALNTAEQGLALIQIIESVYEAAETGKSVAIWSGSLLQ